MKSTRNIFAIICAAIMVTGTSFAQTWQLNGTTLRPVGNYNVFIPGTSWVNPGDQAVLYFGDATSWNNSIKSVWGQGIKISTYGAVDALTISDGSGNVTVTKGDLILSMGKLNIKNSWTIEAPDYVFKKDYNLKTLPEVEKYIKENQHLPEIPSAAEMAKNGVELTELNMKLLKKMEEMTLYIIDQNKKVEELEKKVSMLTPLKN